MKLLLTKTLNLCYLLFLYVIFLSSATLAQNPLLEDGKIRFRLNEDGSHYVRLTFLNQVWVRYNQNNPGSTVNGEVENNVFDIGLRRTRIQLFGQVTDQVFFYMQFGQNNFGYRSTRKFGAFFHDALVEYHVSKGFQLGTGLTAYTGFARHASPSIGSLLALDAPLFLQTTNDQSDQFIRKLSIYAKGQVGQLDYRVALTKPLLIQNPATLGANSTFSTSPPSVQSQTYVKYQFLEHESNRTPYHTGSYLGKKKVFNIGAGVTYQPNAMWHIETGRTDTSRSDMVLWGIDAFFDHPLSEKGNAITAYGGFFNTQLGPNYFRNVGVMNPAEAVNSNGTFGGAGNGFPMVGTGTTIYAQVGYLTGKDTFGKYGTLQPFGLIQYSNYEVLNDPMLMWALGANWLIDGHRSKLSLGYQNRPIFQANNAGEFVNTESKGMFVLQYQINL
ncbi:hypothetical protein BKI52_21840 [marine bacterium AO1-C]|nr:hypothetical protein BKI52_21840 [marine bacterium AO1-C]